MNNVILIVSSDSDDRNTLRNVLITAKDGPFTVVAVDSLAEALNRVAVERIDIVLVDLNLSDSSGLATFDNMYRVVPDTPIMILASMDEEPDAITAVSRGAQGYLSKGYFLSSLVPQALRNIIHRKSVEAALFVEQERGKVILESIGEAVLSTDLSGKVTYLNAAAEAVTGWRKDLGIGRPFGEVAPLIYCTSREPVWDHLQTSIEQDKPVQGAGGMLLVRRDGHETGVILSAAPVHERSGQITGAVVVIHDTSAAEAATFLKMTYLAQHDCLTDLPNRLLLNDRISHAISLAARHTAHLAILFLDLDNFKNVNDSLGHAIGDKLLQSVANRLTGCMRTCDTVSRQGGDEFIIVTDVDDGIDEVSLTAENIMAELAAPHYVAGHRLQVTASIGISVFPEDGRDPDTLLKNADAAMYHAKSLGRNNYQFFDAEMNRRAVERQTIEAHLREAIERMEFVLHFQPKVNLKTGSITGAEALLRWRHPQLGLVLPDYFVPIAEDCGLIGSIGRWVLQEACTQARAWTEAGFQSISMGVNVSASEILSDDFLNGIRDVLHGTRFDPHYLELELTETVLMQDVDINHAALCALKRLGVKLSIDDFGTGYSSLSYLRHFPIDSLKIDKSFVMSMEPESDSGIIINAVIGLAKSLKLDVVAEGVETQEQWEFLESHQCEFGQGNYFSEPLPADQFMALLKAGVLPVVPGSAAYIN